ncbi:MAG: hypothetical protein Q8O67_21510 [Deltaproteobacteria bacterium]|nr:hypothetical protein [Deltaproteobacteria bacterium]
MERYNETRLRTDVDRALKSIRTVLDNTKNPQSPAEVPHRYDDKYLLAELLTRTAGAAVLQGLHGLGLSGDTRMQMVAWARQRSVTLRLSAMETCTFLREESRKVESAHHVIEKKTLFGGTEQVTEKIVSTVKEYFWSFDVTWELVAFQGNEPEKPLLLSSRTARIEIKTNAKITPRPERVVRTPLDANVTWLLGQLDADYLVAFAIDRLAKDCHTPRRNDEVDAALQALDELAGWCHRVHSWFVHELFPVQQEHGRDLTAIHARDVFVPVVPLFEANGEPDADVSVGERSAAYAPAFLAEQRRSLQARCAQLGHIFPRDASLITVVEAVLLTSLLHVADVCQRYADGVNHIEAMLRDQLIAAIGKQLTPADFTAYMDFHHKKLFKPQYRPHPFSYAVRRPDHDPEGVVSIEAQQGSPTSEPISTSVARGDAPHPMSFALDAATRVRFHGDRYLHTWVSHQFSGTSSPSLQLIARARQFSNFIVLAGRISSADTFEPKIGIIVQNKDVLKIPLLLEQIPTPKEFRDAIESLSPEQQRFAKAFRGMQLESTLFAVCIIQIKPQLEALLKLPPDSLTKEIKLTQDLMNLFVEYQIPSDLISYDGPVDAPQETKLTRVTEHVGKMLHLLDASKRREVEEAQEREALRLAETNRTQYAIPPPPPYPMSAPPMPYPKSAPPSAGGPPMMAPASAPRGAMPPPPMAAPSFAPPPPSAPAPPPPPPPVPQVAAPVASSTSTPTQSLPRPDAGPSAPSASGEPVDYTRIPAELDKKFEELDEGSALRPTIINPGDVWTRSSQKGLLSAPIVGTLSSNEQKTERNKAFDLLDALSRSGALPIEHASLHVVIAATHCFDKTLLDTVIEQNVNPIEKVERSVVIVATAVHRQPATALLMDDQRERFLRLSPGLAGQTTTSVEER